MDVSLSEEPVTVLAGPDESETLEFKETTATHREAAMTVCTFLNQGGVQVLHRMIEIVQ